MSPDSPPAPSRRLLAVPIAILCGCALVAIVLILGGSGIDETSARALGTAAVLAVASLMASACLLLVRRRPELALLGFLGILIVAIAFLSSISAIWDVAHDSSQARSLFGVSAVLAIACAHASLLLANARQGEADAVRLVRAGALGAMVLLVILLCAEIVTRGHEVSWKAIGVFAVLYVLGTLLLPLVRIATRSSEAPQSVVSPPVPVAAEAPSAVQLDAAIADLCDQGFEIVVPPAPTQGAHGPALGASLRDPNGRLLELIAY
jgi:drug/metabolite transporter (DMT)-like permease